MNLPQGCKPIGCKWISERMRPDGFMKNIARLVAKECTQKEGVD